ncbi:unnamed protein product, partial [Prorocentrum cordatum]
MEHDALMELEARLPLAMGGAFKWPIARPDRLVQRCVEASPALQRMFAQTISAPVRPWRLVLARDEVTPGAVLRPCNRRKFAAFYFSLLELGGAALRRDCRWLPVAILRSLNLGRIAGGPSCALRMLLRHLLIEPGNLVQGGIRPCLKCVNVLGKCCDCAGGQLVRIDCIDATKFIPNADDNVWRVHDTLAGVQGVAHKAARDRKEKSLGVNFVQEGVLADLDLRRCVGPVSSCRFDWMRTHLCNGIASQEVFEFMSACKSTDQLSDIYPMLESYLKAGWSFPLQHKDKRVDAHAVFCKCKEK